MNYEQELERLILSLSAMEDLAALVLEIGEVYPTLVSDIVSRLGTRKALTSIEVKRLTNFRPVQYIEMRDDLPVPHPLDGDWRLDDRTRQAVCKRLVSTSDMTPVLLLGVPTVHREMQLAGAPSILVDGDAAILGCGFPPESLLIGEVAALQPLSEPVRVTLADPPWYSQPTKSFMGFAAKSTQVGGHILLSLPGRLTRPGIDQEREELAGYASSIGLRLINVERHALRYMSPPFELASLAVAGLSGFPPNWRCGDLAVFEKITDTVVDAPEPTGKESWVERVIHGVRIRFRLKHEKNFDPTPVPLTPSRVRLTVSARDSIIPNIDVWTSGNQIFRCDSPYQLVTIADSVLHRCSPITMIERNLRRTLLPHERALVERARAELDRFVDLDYTRRFT